MKHVSSRLTFRICKLNNSSSASIHHTTSSLSVVNAATESQKAKTNLIEENAATKTEFEIPFAKARLGNFFQPEPELRNQFDEDPVLKSYLRRHLPSPVYADVERDLHAFGKRVTEDILELHRECEANPPKLEQFDAWGKRVDRLLTCNAWKQMKRISAEEGLVAIPYENKYLEWSRLYQVAKSMLFGPSAGLYSCPLSMTDGAAKIICESKRAKENPVLVEAYANLTSRDPEKFWTSGQWMTERGGGSDVASGCETLAIPNFDGTFSLHGHKWFSSATDSDMAMTLARVVDAEGKVEEGTRGLSMFYLEVKKRGEHALNNIEVMKLKNKLGTRQLPTAELLLHGAQAHLVSPPGRGVATIAPMLAITRLHNAMMAVAALRRVVNLAKDYANKRTAFGKKIIDHPLHTQTLCRLEMETRAATLLVLEVARLLGKQDADSLAPAGAAKLTSEREDLLLRILTPLMKLYTAKQAIAGISEGIEAFGGQGYIEDTGIPGYLRDAQVMSIWEGTTNILSLDVLRAMTKSQGKVVESLFDEIQTKIEANERTELTSAVDAIKNATTDTAHFIIQNQTNKELLEVSARDLAFSMTRIFMGSLLVEHANATGSHLDIEIARRWCEQQQLGQVATSWKSGLFCGESLKLDRNIVMQCMDT